MGLNLVSLSELKKRGIVSLFSGDIAFQVQSKLSFPDLVVTQRVLSLFSNHIYIPFSFVIRSPNTRKMILNDELLLEKKIFVAGIDSRLGSIDNYLEKYPFKAKGVFDGLEENAKKQLLEEIETIGDKFRIGTIYETSILGEYGKDHFFLELGNKWLSEHYQLYKELQKTYPFDILNREWLLNWAYKRKLPEPLVKQIYRLGNWSYLYAHVKYYRWNVETPRKFLFSMLGPSEKKMTVEDLVFLTTTLLQIDKAILYSMSPEEFLEIRNDPLFVRIRNHLLQRNIEKLKDYISLEEILEVLVDELHWEKKMPSSPVFLNAISIDNFAKNVLFLSNVPDYIKENVTLLIPNIFKTGPKIPIKSRVKQTPSSGTSVGDSDEYLARKWIANYKIKEFLEKCMVSDGLVKNILDDLG